MSMVCLLDLSTKSSSSEGQDKEGPQAELKQKKELTYER